LGATPHEFESRILRQCLTGDDVEGPHRSRWGPSSLSVSVSVSVRFREFPQSVADLLRDLAEHGARHVHVPGPHPGRSSRLPTRDRVDHDVRDAEDQQDGRGGVASVVETAVPEVTPVVWTLRQWILQIQGKVSWWDVGLRIRRSSGTRRWRCTARRAGSARTRRSRRMSG
jgi:hypothetical protein